MNRSRFPVSILLIVSFLVAGFTRQWAADQRNSGVGAAHAGSGGAGLDRMNSYALALLLGGLRGPLVMFLWPSAEEQKQKKNLEDFDTKIEWIRLLQAEFDTVHLFQIWNKAYNISAQMANLSNKYRAILDALDYAHSVDVERPNDINIIETIGQLYFDKLGTSAENPYYREKIREQSQARQELVRITLPPARRDQLIQIAMNAGISPRRLSFSTDAKTGNLTVTLPKPIVDLIEPQFNGPDIIYTPRAIVHLDRNDPGWRRTELDPILDTDGNILPEYLLPRLTKPADLDPNSEWNDGSELQYLKKYEPFRYGVSTFALAFNYEKRAQVLQSVNKQHHAQLSDVVINSRPGLALKNWSEEEWARGRRAELEAFNQPVPQERLEMELPTAPITLQTPITHPALLEEAIYSYKKSTEIIDDSVKEYMRHLSSFQTNVSTYILHIEGLRAEQALELGDYYYLLALKDPTARDNNIKSSREHYLQAIRLNQLVTLQYFISDELAQHFFPPEMTRATIAKANLSDQKISELYDQIRTATSNQADDDFAEYARYIDRARLRLKNLAQ